MQQLRQRVIASYHLGPMDAEETKAYIEHRLTTVGWKGDPSFSDGAHDAIFAYTGGIPRKVNTLADRLLLMGFLEEMHGFEESNVADVIRDINQEFELPSAVAELPVGNSGATAMTDPSQPAQHAPAAHAGHAPLSETSPLLDERMMRLEKSVVSVLNILKKIVATPAGANSPLNHNND
jgi:hypothetical protein